MSHSTWEEALPLSQSYCAQWEFYQLIVGGRSVRPAQDPSQGIEDADGFRVKPCVVHEITNGGGATQGVAAYGHGCRTNR